ncbi:hypothetical protein J6590_067729 [Homalodisca vitripennis]|nr:hypothetical protein J6590_067729 [Homalodisca vitripennis]
MIGTVDMTCNIYTHLRCRSSLTGGATDSGTVHGRKLKFEINTCPAIVLSDCRRRGARGAAAEAEGGGTKAGGVVYGTVAVCSGTQSAPDHGHPGSPSPALSESGGSAATARPHPQGAAGQPVPEVPVLGVRHQAQGRISSSTGSSCEKYFRVWETTERSLPDKTRSRLSMNQRMSPPS